MPPSPTDDTFARVRAAPRFPHQGELFPSPRTLHALSASNHESIQDPRRYSPVQVEAETRPAAGGLSTVGEDVQTLSPVRHGACGATEPPAQQ